MPPRSRPPTWASPWASAVPMWHARLPRWCCWTTASRASWPPSARGMIPVRGYAGAKVAVLGLGRSGLATARALVAGGAEALLWDDSPEARAKAEAEGFTLTDLGRNGAFDGVAALVTSHGIPHLYPE